MDPDTDETPKREAAAPKRAAAPAAPARPERRRGEPKMGPVAQRLRDAAEAG